MELNSLLFLLTVIFLISAISFLFANVLTFFDEYCDYSPEEKGIAIVVPFEAILPRCKDIQRQRRVNIRGALSVLCFILAVASFLILYFFVGK